MTTEIQHDLVVVDEFDALYVLILLPLPFLVSAAGGERDARRRPLLRAPQRARIQSKLLNAACIVTSQVY